MPLHALGDADSILWKGSVKNVDLQMQLFLMMDLSMFSSRRVGESYNLKSHCPCELTKGIRCL